MPSIFYTGGDNPDYCDCICPDNGLCLNAVCSTSWTLRINFTPVGDVTLPGWVILNQNSGNIDIAGGGPPPTPQAPNTCVEQPIVSGTFALGTLPGTPPDPDTEWWYELSVPSTGLRGYQCRSDLNPYCDCTLQFSVPGCPFGYGNLQLFSRNLTTGVANQIAFKAIGGCHETNIVGECCFGVCRANPTTIQASTLSSSCIEVTGLSAGSTFLIHYNIEIIMTTTQAGYSCCLNN